MAQNRIGLNLVTLKNGKDADALLKNMDLVQEAGFEGVGLWVSTVQQWLESGRSVSELAGETNDRNLLRYPYLLRGAGGLYATAWTALRRGSGQVAGDSKVGPPATPQQEPNSPLSL